MFNHLNRSYDRLKPCPFCGCEKIDFGQYRKDGLRVICKRCSVKREQRVRHQTLAWLEGKMVEMWNQRSPDPESTQD